MRHKTTWGESASRHPKAFHSRIIGKRSVCKEARCSSHQLQAEIQLIVDLLKYTTFFRRQPHSAVNFSLLQAVTSWIQEALRSAPFHLPDITRSADILSHAVASTSGLGLNDIWLSWTSSISPSSYTAELEQAILDTDDSGDGHGESHTPGVSDRMLTPHPEIRSQLLEHITTRYLKTRTTLSAAVHPGNAPVSSNPEQVGFKYHPLSADGGNNTSSVDLA
jgi:hypothetical protein